MITALPQLVWHSSFASFTGYSGSALAFVLGLDQRGVAVRPLYLYGADYDEQLAAGRMHPEISRLQQVPLNLAGPQVVYAPGDRFSKNSGAYRIGYTMLESDRLPPDWVHQANQLDEIWTPSTWGAGVFLASGITRPIHVVPLGIDPQQYRPAESPKRLPDRTVFLSIFEWSKRKGYDLLLRAYRAAFRANDPVQLILKIDHHAPGNPIREIESLLGSSAAPVALLYNQGLPATRLAELYQLADCFVLPSRGEGWGMPILEAMACGVPAIATNWSAPTMFLNEQNGYPLPYQMQPADPGHRYLRYGQSAEPDVAALVELLRHVAAHPAERHAKGQQAAREARNWSWNRAIDTVVARLGVRG
jgi:glycosyltransferase involved in cell wall biosynthesis